ncbi:MAG: hypothetical protein K0R55_1288 [Sporomusa sp.]|jgi:hypothetical protein|nr:hypothetical protein [Sporomusa sp.]
MKLNGDGSPSTNLINRAVKEPVPVTGAVKMGRDDVHD